MLNFIVQTTLLAKRPAFSNIIGRRKSNLIGAFLTIALSLLTILQAQATTYYSKNGGGNWVSKSSWSTTADGTGAQGTPLSTDNVVIQNGHTITLSGDATCASLTINAPVSSLTGTSLLNVGTRKLVANSLTILRNTGDGAARLTTSSGSVDINGNITFAGTAAGSNTIFEFTGAGILNLAGNLGNNGNFISGSNSTVIFDGSLVQTIPGGLSFANVEIVNTSSTGVNLTGNMSCNSLKINKPGTPALTCVFNITNSAILTVNGAVTIDKAKKPQEKNANTLNVGSGTLLANSLELVGANPRLGKVSVSTGLVDVRGNLIFSGDTAKSIFEFTGVGTLKIGGELGSTGTFRSYTSGAMSTVIFDGQSQQTMGVGYTYGNVIARNPVGVRIKSDVTPTILKGNLTVETGLFDNNGSTLSGASGKTLALFENTSLALSGTTTFPTGFGIVSIHPFSNVIYQGSTQTVAVQTYGNLSIRNAGIKTLAGDITIAGNLDFNAGKLDVGNYMISVLDVINAAATGYVVTSGALGKLAIRNIGSGGKSGEVLFPVGSFASYTPAYITNAGSAEDFSVNVTDGLYGHGATAGWQVIDHVVNKTWNVKPVNSNGTPDVTLKLQWNQADQGPGFDPLLCGINYFYNNGWDQPVFSSGATANGTTYSVIRSGITSFSPFGTNFSFSPFGVSDGSNPLPVELVYLKVSKKEGKGLVEWGTATEKNNSGFEVQVSADGKKFDKIGFVESQNPNSNTRLQYAFTDKQNRSGLWYYRLVQTDFDGTASVFGPKVLDFGKTRAGVTVYPNPFQDQFELKLNTDVPSDVFITLQDMTGKTVYAGSENVHVGNNRISVKMPEQLESGVYLLTVVAGQQSAVTRIIKQ